MYVHSQNFGLNSHTKELLGVEFEPLPQTDGSQDGGTHDAASWRLASKTFEADVLTLLSTLCL